jgi:hypothetical protein
MKPIARRFSVWLAVGAVAWLAALPRAGRGADAPAGTPLGPANRVLYNGIDLPRGALKPVTVREHLSPPP